MRPIALLCLIYRLMMRILCAEKVVSWDSAMVSSIGAEDTAGAGSNSYHTACKRQALMETGYWRNFPVAQIVWDFSTFLTRWTGRSSRRPLYWRPFPWSS